MKENALFCLIKLRSFRGDFIRSPFTVKYNASVGILFPFINKFDIPHLGFKYLVSDYNSFGFFWAFASC